MSQPLEALQRANASRIAAARVKARVAALSAEDGACLVAGLLRDPDEATGAIRLNRLIGSIRRFGPARVTRLLNRCPVIAWHDKPIRGLTEHQRRLVAAEIERVAAQPRRTPGRSRADIDARHARLLELAAQGVDEAEIAQQLGYAHAASVRRTLMRLTARNPAGGEGTGT